MILEACPVCGGEMQMTTVGEVYYNFVDGEWERADASEDEIRVYCENDHQVTDRAILTAMSELPKRDRLRRPGESNGNTV